MLYPRVVLETINREVFSVAGVLEATVWHFGDKGDVGVDPYAAEIKVARHPHGAAVVACPHARREPVFDPVCPLQCLCLVVELLHRYHRPEDFLLGHFVVLAQAGDHCRGKAIAAVTDLLASREHFHVAGRALQETPHPCELAGTVQGTVGDVVLTGAILAVGAYFCGACLVYKGIDEIAMDAGRNQHSRCRRAILPGVEVAGHRYGLCGRATSASSNTMTGALPPSSRCTRFRSPAAEVATSIPARTLPVMDTMAGMLFATSARPVSRSPQTTLRTPGGTCSARISASSKVLTGVVSEGLRTIVLPAAIAGAHFHTAIIIG